jgi:class 3 adenylate cyclase/pimeloyl-ACP methyl ester carboxylesterase
VAYQVFGSGDVDLVWMPGFVTHLEFLWTIPPYAEFMEQLGRIVRVVVFDRPGTGMSDPVPRLAAFEERVDDALSVMAAAGVERPVLFGFSEGAPLAILLASARPESTRGLILYGSFADASLLSESTWTRLQDIAEHWGEGRMLPMFGPSLSDNPIMRRLIATFERVAASPGMAKIVIDSFRDVNVAAILPTLHTPTLVLHRAGDFIPIEGARRAATAIDGAQFIELPGIDHPPFLGDTAPILRAIGDFVVTLRDVPDNVGSTASPDAPPPLASSAPASSAPAAALDSKPRSEVEVEGGGGGRSWRALATVLFTDIVGSTRRAVQMGDARWAELLDRHHHVVRRHLAAHGGREIDTAGDGFFAAFDGPANAIRCVRAAAAELAGLGIEIRAGVHTGECEFREGGARLSGVAVHVGARVAARAGAGEVLVTQTVRDLVMGSELQFESRGDHELKGVPGEWPLYAVENETTATPVPTDASDKRVRPMDRLIVRAARAPGAAHLFNLVSKKR